VANRGVDEIVDHFAAIIEPLPVSPILIGHSFGGTIAEKLLGQGHGAAAMAIDAAWIEKRGL
jgi:pimeloyl-ACP methyl ester carboxylesterase